MDSIIIIIIIGCVFFIYTLPCTKNFIKIYDIFKSNSSQETQIKNKTFVINK